MVGFRTNRRTQKPFPFETGIRNRQLIERELGKLFDSEESTQERDSPFMACEFCERTGKLGGLVCMNCGGSGVLMNRGGLKGALPSIAEMFRRKLGAIKKADKKFAELCSEVGGLQLTQPIAEQLLVYLRARVEHREPDPRLVATVSDDLFGKVVEGVCLPNLLSNDISVLSVATSKMFDNAKGKASGEQIIAILRRAVVEGYHQKRNEQSATIMQERRAGEKK
jgi:hypothetical protein